MKWNEKDLKETSDVHWTIHSEKIHTLEIFSEYEQNVLDFYNQHHACKLHGSVRSDGIGCFWFTRILQVYKNNKLRPSDTYTSQSVIFGI